MNKPLVPSVAAVEVAESAAVSPGMRSLLKRLHVVEQENQRVRRALEDQRQGLQNLLEFRKLASGRYGTLTREEIEESIVKIDAALAGLAEAPPATATGKATPEDADD